MKIKLIVLCIFILTIFSMTDMITKAIAINLVSNPTKENIDSYNVNDNGKIVNVPATIDTTGQKKLKYPIKIQPGVNTYKAQAVANNTVSGWSQPLTFDTNKPEQTAGCAVLQ